MKYASPKVTTTFGSNFIVFRFKPITFTAGEKYPVTDKDWFGRDLYELSSSDEWFEGKDLNFFKQREPTFYPV